MAQPDPRSMQKKSTKLRNSLSQPATSNSANQQSLSARRHLTLTISSNNDTRPPSTQVDSPSTASSLIGSNVTQLTISPSHSAMTHAELMQNWREKQIYEMSKKRKHQYTYTVPHSPTTCLASFASWIPPPHANENKGVKERSRTFK